MGKHGAEVIALRELLRIRGLGLSGAEKVAGQVLASKSRENAISDPIRQHIRPLIDGLVGDANCVCGGRHAPAEQFDGFGLEHVSLNHSSAVRATIVQAAPRTLSTMVEYKDRLQWAMSQAGVTVSALASHLDISYQAVKKVVDGKSKEFTSKSNAAAADFLKVDPYWLATGKGEARPKPISSGNLTPMEAQMLTMYRVLPPHLQHEIESQINSAYAGQTSDASTANPFGKTRPKPAAKPAKLGDKAHKEPFKIGSKVGAEKKGKQRNEA